MNRTGFVFAVLFLFLADSIFGQKPPVFQPEGDSSLAEVVITATKFNEKRKHIVQRIDVITRSSIELANTPTTGDLLQYTGRVFVQKSQLGGSSPNIRGFEASRILLMVDGIRMNNAIYRSGHLQNVITIDQNMLERAEVIFGPGSTLHGSDALGGVVAFKTIDPRLANEKGKTIWKGSTSARYGSAANEKSLHVHNSIGGLKWGALVGVTVSDFGDLKMGSRYPEKYPDFGRRRSYAGRINGRDTILANPDDRIQIFSGYRQYDLTAKLLYQPKANQQHLINIQYSNSSDIPRYDRLQDTRNGRLRYAEWYYGPQKRALYAYTYTRRLHAWFNDLRITASYQDVEESRYQRELFNPLRQNRIENLGVGGFYFDLRKFWKNHELHTGLDFQWNNVTSRAFTLDIITAETGKLDTRYPEKNSFHSYAAYFQHLYKFPGNKLVLNDGIRVQTNFLRSQVLDSTTSFRPFTDLRQKPAGFSGNIGLIYMPAADMRLTAGISTGFRAPNVDDLTKIFESSTSARQLVVPNPGITPEKTISPEIGFTWKPTPGLQFEASAFYTWFRDAIVLNVFQVNGKDSMDYHGVRYQTLSAQNAAKARLAGGNISFQLKPSTKWLIGSTASITNGRYFRPGGEMVPLDHIPPFFGKTNIRFTTSRWLFEGWLLYNGWKRIADYNPDGEDNAQYATPEGMPSWTTVNFRSSFAASELLTGHFAVENIADRNYRVFASGLSAPGRNFVFSLRISW